MKNLLKILCIHCFCFTMIGNAQTSFIIGGTGGINLSKYKFLGDDDLDRPSSKFGLGGGLHVGIEFGKLAVLTGAQFSQKGTKNEFDLFDTNTGVKIGVGKVSEKISTIHIPILVRYKIFGESFGVNIAAGPTINLILNGSSKFNATLFDGQKLAQTTTLKIGSDTKDQYKSNYVGFIISPQIFMKVGEKGKVNLNINFDLGATDMLNRNYLNDNAQSYADEYKQFSNAVTFSVTYEHRIQFGDKY